MNLGRQYQKDKKKCRFGAVVALLKGRPVSKIITEFGICRSDLYKFRKRALMAMQEALSDYPRGPKIPHNRLSKEKERPIKLMCQRHPTLSSCKIKEKLGSDSPCSRTIQRLRERVLLPRLPKRTSPQSEAKRFSLNQKQQVKDYIEKQPHLGALRLSWDVMNILQIPISASTVLGWRKELKKIPMVEVIDWQFYERKHPHSLWHGDILKLWYFPDGKYLAQMTFMDDYSRGYVFCELTTEPTTLYTVQCLIQAMRQWQVIPKAILVDNGSEFTGFLLREFCDNLGIQIIHIRVRHPQTNGKLERAFRDDRRDFYGLRKGWSVDALKRDLPDYVYYRNYQRGHWALKGQPAINRLKEQNRVALPSILHRLEEYAVCEVGQKCVNSDGFMRILGRPLYLGKRFGGISVKCFETMDGLEIRNDVFVIGTLPNYQEYRRFYNSYRSYPLPEHFVLQHGKKINKSPRIAVA